MALSPHPRKFILHVTEVEVDPADNFADAATRDQIKLVFHGKLLPSTKKRIENVYYVGGTMEVIERHLA